MVISLLKEQDGKLSFFVLTVEKADEEVRKVVEIHIEDPL
jgi:hypothetical protein